MSSVQHQHPETDQKIAVSQFKARCLSLVDEVARTGVPYVVTKRGKPMARLVPLDQEAPTSLLGSVRYESEEDLLSPIGDVWEMDT